MTDWDRVGLGERSDREIGKELGVPTSKVQRERTRRGIPPFRVHRPTRNGSPAPQVMTIRLTLQEQQRLERDARRAGLCPSDYVRKRLGLGG